LESISDDEKFDKQSDKIKIAKANTFLNKSEIASPATVNQSHNDS